MTSRTCGECDAGSAIESHRDALDLEARFAYRDRLRRIFGDHDDLWATRGAFSRLQAEVMEEMPPVDVVEGLRFDVFDRDAVGTILLVHGHQGTALSDHGSRIGRLFLRRFLQPLRRRAGRRPPVLSQDYALRQAHEIAMSEWAAAKRDLLLICGHTHHPVFGGEARETFVERRIEELAADAAGFRDEVLRRDAELRVRQMQAELSYQEELCGGHLLRRGDSHAAYFNTGCCSFPSGSITGIELADSEIRLVRWREEKARPQREVLRRRDLRTAFSALRELRSAPSEDADDRSD